MAGRPADLVQHTTTRAGLGFGRVDDAVESLDTAEMGAPFPVVGVRQPAPL